MAEIDLTPVEADCVRRAFAALNKAADDNNDPYAPTMSIEPDATDGQPPQPRHKGYCNLSGAHLGPEDQDRTVCNCGAASEVLS